MTNGHAGASSSVSEKEESGDLEVSMHVKDGGMKLVRILTPDFRWQSGNANIRLKLHGRPGDLALDGGMQISKATVTSPFLRYPMTNIAANVGLADNVVQAGLLVLYQICFHFSNQLDIVDCALLKPCIWNGQKCA